MATTHVSTAMDASREELHSHARKDESRVLRSLRCIADPPVTTLPPFPALVPPD
jgi:hypothetical protein